MSHARPAASVGRRRSTVDGAVDVAERQTTYLGEPDDPWDWPEVPGVPTTADALLGVPVYSPPLAAAVSASDASVQHAPAVSYRGAHASAVTYEEALASLPTYQGSHASVSTRRSRLARRRWTRRMGLDRQTRPTPKARPARSARPEQVPRPLRVPRPARVGGAVSGLFAGAFAALAAVLVWGVAAAEIGSGLGLLAIGLGALVGVSVRRFGGPSNDHRVFAGAFWAFLGSVLGFYAQTIVAVSSDGGIGFRAALSDAHWTTITANLGKQPLDWLFALLAVGVATRLVRRASA
jgi:hypothetical protein